MCVWICVSSATPPADRRKQSTAHFRYVCALRIAQRQAFAQRRLVDLDQADAGLLEIEHLIADRERDLPAGRRPRLVVAHEGPLQDRHRPGEHALHRPLGERLRIGRPFDRHRLGPRHIAEDDRRLHVARAVGLHPAVLREGEARQLLAEVLDHVVALEFAVHQHVDVRVPPGCARRSPSPSSETRCRPHRRARPCDVRRGPCAPPPSAGTNRWSWSGRPAAGSTPAASSSVLRTDFAARDPSPRPRRCVRQLRDCESEPKYRDSWRPHSSPGRRAPRLSCHLSRQPPASPPRRASAWQTPSSSSARRRACSRRRDQLGCE